MLEHNLNKYRGISFPLNVYALLTFFKTGEFRELHYGLFNDTNNDFIQAQENSTDLLLKYICKSPSKLLEVGIGLGNTHQKLIDKGFVCTGITPDATQISIVNESIKNTNLVCTRFEDFNPEEETYDIILFQESAQYIQAHDLFTKGFQLLTPHGRILIVDEFSREGEILHNLDCFVSMAESVGFKLIHKKDLSVKAAPTVDFILKGLVEYQDQICRELKLPSKQLNDLSDALWDYKKKYHEREFAYFFFEFEKKQEIIF